jgi:hypothetical protein
MHRPKGVEEKAIKMKQTKLKNNRIPWAINL